MRKARRKAALGVLALSAFSLLQSACTREGTGQEPVAPGSTEAERELRSLEERSELGVASERAQLERELVAFVEKYATDPGVGRARLILARLLVERGEARGAEQILAPVLTGPAGPVRDEAAVVQARIENDSGRAEAALARLEPLEGKLFSSEARDLWGRERTRAAIETRRWRLALESLDDWVTTTSAPRDAAEKWVRAVVQSVPVSALSRTVLVDDEGREGMRADSFTLRVVLERLTDEALAKGDARLARDLLARAPTWLRTSEIGDRLAELARLVEEEARVTGRLIGLVVGGSTAAERRRSAEAARGLLEGLREEGASSLEWIAEEDRGSLHTALGTLSSRGAALLVAAVDAEDADQALKFAETRQIPVITLAAPRADVTTGRYGFVLGERETDERTWLEGKFVESGVTRHALIGGGGLACGERLTRPGLARFPSGEWVLGGLHGLVVLGDPSCAARVAAEARPLEPKPWLGLGLEAAEGPIPAGFRVLSLGAGSFPRGKNRAPEDRVTASPPVEVPSWYRTLGRDAARLARATVGRLPDVSATSETEVRARHDLVRAALHEAKIPLESSEHAGFGGAQRLPRTVRVEDSNVSRGAP